VFCDKEHCVHCSAMLMMLLPVLRMHFVLSEYDFLWSVHLKILTTNVYFP
jgi:hypothetical protein